MNEQDIRRIVVEMMQNTQYSVAKVPYHVHTGTDSNRIAARNLQYALFPTATTTNGTTAVYVFDATNAPINPTITGVFLVSSDTTAGNISVYNSGKTVATLVKGTVAGAMVGATSLSNSTMATNVTVKSDSAGNSTVFMTFST